MTKYIPDFYREDVIPDFYREDVIPEFKWAVIEPLVALSIRARPAREAYAERVRSEYRIFKSELLWTIDEASAFIKDTGLRPDRVWLGRSIKDTGLAALRLAKTVGGL